MRFAVSLVFVIFLVFVGVLYMSTIRGDSGQTAHAPSLISSIEVDKPLEFCGEPVPLEIQDVRERLEKEMLLSLWDRPQVILWLKRSLRYLPGIEQTLRENGMPDDLKYVAVAESALRPHAGSSKGAIGFWQFMKYTGTKYGLVVDTRFDERRNIFASTKAAIQYFRDLYEALGSWTLAAAAYNMGEDGLMSQILVQGTKDYYRLYLPLETQRYVFRILSVKLIFSDPGRYGFHLSDEDYYPPLEFDPIQIECSQETPILVIAKAAKTDFKVIKDLNPEIRGYYIPEGNHRILIPKVASEGFLARYHEMMASWLGDEQTYEVREGDNLSSIAERFRVPLGAILIWNQLDPNAAIHPGDRLTIHGGKGDSYTNNWW